MLSEERLCVCERECVCISHTSQRVNACKEELIRVSNDNLCEEIGIRLDREYEIKGAFECAEALSCV